MFGRVKLFDKESVNYENENRILEKYLYGNESKISI